ncbi:SGNH/GDSL hydrolase family protein [Mucilaginibacter sp. UR6-11]|uniref:SGNH/GDSL hydrolase family protein n=1 Tax=Mucilaginibacter sp. UR6-11 TaxID=1435644 RepID=UPI001E62CCBA|nr:SGNH/GDSL hydrolase family protein [Mucilaginibacter sp. UR6-11]MCC8425807.1 SGNH/GDSL hydrolase family protein [Mucilaginibacter sp. UR6-11]
MKRSLSNLFLFFCLIATARAQNVQPFHQGDRVVFTGNSITDGGHYHSYIWLYYLTHYPYRRITVFNAGIGGDVAQQIFERLDSDVFAHKPTVMTLTFGMNDTGYQNLKGDKADSVYNAKIAVALKSFAFIKAKLSAHPEVKKIMISSPPYDETSKIKITTLFKKNAAILKIAAEQRNAAAINNWGYVDFNGSLTQVSLQEQQRDSLFTFNNSDRIHPTNDGQMVMAYAFLKAQGLAGAKVADIVINASRKRIERAENCLITRPDISSGVVKFNYLAYSLPYPTDTIPGGFGRPQRAQAEGLKLIPFTDEFNQELLQVKGLKPNPYTLKIDGKTIGTYTGAKLNHGINLALIKNTPQYQQALAILHINEERWEIERRLREYYWIHYSILKPRELLFNDGDATIDSLRKYARKDFFVAVTMPTYRKARFKSVREAWQQEIDTLTNQMYKVNKPVTHRFEITLIK